VSAPTGPGLVRLVLRDGVTATTFTTEENFEALAEALVTGEALVRIDPLEGGEKTIIVVTRHVQSLEFEPGPF